MTNKKGVEMKVKSVNVNGKIYEAKDWDKIEIFEPNGNYPYWQINFSKGDCIKMQIETTGNVAIVKKTLEV